MNQKNVRIILALMLAVSACNKHPAQEEAKGGDGKTTGAENTNGDRDTRAAPPAAPAKPAPGPEATPGDKKVVLGSTLATSGHIGSFQAVSDRADPKKFMEGLNLAVKDNNSDHKDLDLTKGFALSMAELDATQSNGKINYSFEFFYLKQDGANVVRDAPEDKPESINLGFPQDAEALWDDPKKSYTFNIPNLEADEDSNFFSITTEEVAFENTMFLLPVTLTDGNNTPITKIKISASGDAVKLTPENIQMINYATTFPGNTCYFYSEKGIGEIKPVIVSQVFKLDQHKVFLDATKIKVADLKKVPKGTMKDVVLRCGFYVYPKDENVHLVTASQTTGFEITVDY